MILEKTHKNIRHERNTTNRTPRKRTENQSKTYIYTTIHDTDMMYRTKRCVTMNNQKTTIQEKRIKNRRTETTDGRQKRKVERGEQ